MRQNYIKCWAVVRKGACVKRADFWTLPPAILTHKSRVRSRSLHVQHMPHTVLIVVVYRSYFKKYWSRNRFSKSHTICSSVELFREIPLRVKGNSLGSSEETGSCTHWDTILIPWYCWVMACWTNPAWDGASSSFTYLSDFIKAKFPSIKWVLFFCPANHKTEDTSFVYLTTLVSKFYDTSHFKKALHGFWSQSSCHLHKGSFCTRLKMHLQIGTGGTG